MSQFERTLNELLERTKNIKPPINAASIGFDKNEYNRPSEDWINDVEIFYKRYLKDHPLSNRISKILALRGIHTYADLLSCLNSISRDREYLEQKSGIETTNVPKYKAKTLPEYDVFLSHANKDKDEIVDELNESLEKLKVSIFYDKKSLEWGDKWKERILEGTQKSEFVDVSI